MGIVVLSLAAAKTRVGIGTVLPEAFMVTNSMTAAVTLTGANDRARYRLVSASDSVNDLA